MFGASILSQILQLRMPRQNKYSYILEYKLVSLKELMMCLMELMQKDSLTKNLIKIIAYLNRIMTLENLRKIITMYTFVKKNECVILECPIRHLRRTWIEKENDGVYSRLITCIFYNKTLPLRSPFVENEYPYHNSVFQF